jgi:hypothetical protein
MGREIPIPYLTENCIIWGDLHSSAFSFDEFKSGRLHERHDVATGNSEFEDRGKARERVTMVGLANNLANTRSTSLT